MGGYGIYVCPKSYGDNFTGCNQPQNLLKFSSLKIFPLYGNFLKGGWIVAGNGQVLRLTNERRGWLHHCIHMHLFIDLCTLRWWFQESSGSGSEVEGNEAKEKELRERALNSLKKAKKSHYWTDLSLHARQPRLDNRQEWLLYYINLYI